MANRKATNLIIIHCAATRPSQDIGAKEIDEWHRRKGYLSIGYHHVIRRDGTIEPGRSLQEIGAHASGHNAESVGVCLVGGVSENNVNKPENNFTPAQMNTLTALVADLKAAFPQARVIGHRDVNPGKACPSFDATAWAAATFK